MRIGVVSLGCAKNRVDTEEMLALLTQAGYELTDQAGEAEVLVVNTCGFITSAKEESIDTIFEMAQHKETGKCRALVVTGCLAQRYGQELLEEIPQIDVLSGVDQYDSLAGAIELALKKGERSLNTKRTKAFLHCGRVLTTPSYSAYIRIAEGCDNRCAYCAIPLIRGGFRSRPRGDILREMRELADKGVSEQVLIAQDTSNYGKDLPGESLARLIGEAAAIPGIRWLRLLYCYPDGTDRALIDEMAKYPNVVRYLDLPLQHAVPRLLKAMNRRGDIGEIRALLQYARSQGFALRSTFIVGFPGETDEDFEQLMDFIREVRFDRLGAFSFSAEEDTAAALMPDQVPESVKQDRLQRLMQLQGEISLSLNQARIGTKTELLITGCRGRLYTARSPFEAPEADGLVYLDSDRALKPGQYVKARITGAQRYDLTAVLLEDEA